MNEYKSDLGMEEFEGEEEIKKMAEESMTTLGGSLAAPNVQALAATCRDMDIPERYIRPNAELADPVADDVDLKLPIIDFRRAQVSQEESARIGRACQDWGFFQLTNHGVPTELIEKMKVDIAAFFKLPLVEKEVCAKRPGSLDGYGAAFVHSEEQKLDWVDQLAYTTFPLSARNITVWPTNPPTFRETMDAYATAMKEVAICLLRLIADNLGLVPETITDKFKNMQQAVVINYYPPYPKPEKVIGLTPHSDGVGLTIVLQATDVQGLQIRKNGKWFSVKPLPDMFIVNVGDMLEIFSNGKYKSIEHRAVVNNEKERLSIVTFHAPPMDCTIRPLRELIEGNVENYKTTSFKDYMKGYVSSRLEGKSQLEKMKLKNH